MVRRRYIKQAAQELGVSQHFLRLQAKQGLIPCFMSGNRYIFDIDQCEEFLRNKALENVKPQIENDGYGTLRRVNG